jgi:uncharacterized protein YbjT (DUF2867 family)
VVRDADKAKKTFDDLHGVEIVAGAFDDETVLAKAFDGVDVAFLALGRRDAVATGERPPRTRPV